MNQTILVPRGLHERRKPIFAGQDFDGDTLMVSENASLTLSCHPRSDRHSSLVDDRDSHSSSQPLTLSYSHRVEMSPLGDCFGGEPIGLNRESLRFHCGLL